MSDGPSVENDVPLRVEPSKCGTCFTSGWYGSRRGSGHLHCDCGRPCVACPLYAQRRGRGGTNEALMPDAEKDPTWDEPALGYVPKTIIMCLGEKSCDAPYWGEEGVRYHCRRPPGHSASVGHDCPADRDARAASLSERTS